MTTTIEQTPPQFLALPTDPKRTSRQFLALPSKE